MRSELVKSVHHFFFLFITYHMIKMMRFYSHLKQEGKEEGGSKQCEETSNIFTEYFCPLLACTQNQYICNLFLNEDYCT